MTSIETRPHAVAFQGHSREVIDTMGVEWPYSETIVVDLGDEVFCCPERLTADDVRQIMGLGVFDAMVEGLGR